LGKTHLLLAEALYGGHILLYPQIGWRTRAIEGDQEDTVSFSLISNGGMELREWGEEGRSRSWMVGMGQEGCTDTVSVVFPTVPAGLYSEYDSRLWIQERLSSKQDKLKQQPD